MILNVSLLHCHYLITKHSEEIEELTIYSFVLGQALADVEQTMIYTFNSSQAVLGKPTNPFFDFYAMLCLLFNSTWSSIDERSPDPISTVEFTSLLRYDEVGRKRFSISTKNNSLCMRFLSSVRKCFAAKFGLCCGNSTDLLQIKIQAVEVEEGGGDNVMDQRPREMINVSSIAQ